MSELSELLPEPVQTPSSSQTRHEMHARLNNRCLVEDGFGCEQSCCLLLVAFLDVQGDDVMTKSFWLFRCSPVPDRTHQLRRRILLKKLIHGSMSIDEHLINNIITHYRQSPSAHGLSGIPNFLALAQSFKLTYK